jgi:hypothetical protein
VLRNTRIKGPLPSTRIPSPPLRYPSVKRDERERHCQCLPSAWIMLCLRCDWPDAPAVSGVDKGLFLIYGGGGACGICYEFFTILTSTTLAAKTTDA